MTQHDLDILNRDHDEAIKEMGGAAVAIAERACNGEKPTEEEVIRYMRAKLGVESTRRDLEYAIALELDEIMDA